MIKKIKENLKNEEAAKSLREKDRLNGTKPATSKIKITKKGKVQVHVRM